MTISDAPVPHTTDLPFNRWGCQQEAHYVEFRRRADGYVVSFNRLATFFISRHSTNICCWPDKGTTNAELEHLHRQTVVPLASSLQGRLVLHAGAVQFGSRSICFAGDPGAGKSTLTAYLAANGRPFLADDSVEITLGIGGAHFAQPGVAAVRLWQDSADAILAANERGAAVLGFTDKLRIERSDHLRHSRTATAVKAICFLRKEPPEASGLHLKGITASEALLELGKHSFWLDSSDHDSSAKLFEKRANLVAAVPCFWMSYPRQYNYLPQVHELLESCFAE